MSQPSAPIDDTVHLEEMDYFPESDTTPIVSPDKAEHEDRIANTCNKNSIGDDGTSSDSCKTMDEKGAPIFGRKKAYITVATLLFINLLNYMDRFTIAGVLIQVQDYYHISNSKAGLIQTSFILAYMIFSPLFGYLGDRYTRKYIMAAGIFLWSGFTLGASFVGDKYFDVFVVLRALVGIGEASYSTIAPTIIADLFAKQMRTRMLMIFYFAIPVGSGLGFIVGANVADLFHDWRYALRVTPGLGVICVVLILLFCQEPVRGMSESGTHLHTTDIMTDLKSLFRNKSFMLSSVGFTCVAFATGSLAMWAPTFMMDAIAANGGKHEDPMVSFEFGVITVAAGFLGVFLGAEGARWYRQHNSQADPLICAFGLLASVPFLYFSITLARINIPATWFLIFVGETLLCLNWTLTADILLYVVVPTRRSMAEAVQILLSHAFGDAGSPYLTGVVADALTPHVGGTSTSPAIQFLTLQYALYMTAYVCVLGGGAYLATAIYIEADKKAAQRQTQAPDEEAPADDVVIQASAVDSGLTPVV